MKILLTGSRGMVGRNILDHPRATGHDWLVPARSDLDLTDLYAVVDYLDHHQVDAVIHAAGKVGGIQANLDDPVGFLIENLDMGRNVVGAAARVGVKRLINLGSSCMYPKDLDRPLVESDILSGRLEPTNEGYAIAKIAVAKLVEYLACTRGLAYRTLIPCNLYGRHDKFDPVASHLVPAIIQKVHHAKSAGLTRVEIWGDGTARREFLFATDLADATIRAVEDPSAVPQAMNIGVGTDHTVDEYYRIVAEVIGYTGKFEHDISRPVGMKRKLTDVSLATQWGWRANTSLHDGIQSTYEYFINEVAKK